MAHFIECTDIAPEGFRNDAVNLDAIARVRKSESTAHFDKHGNRARSLMHMATSVREVSGPSICFEGVEARADSKWVFETEELRDAAWQRVMEARAA